jgi:RNA polymerase sigma factor (sigma-70 family)
MVVSRNNGHHSKKDSYLCCTKVQRHSTLETVKTAIACGRLTFINVYNEYILSDLLLYLKNERIMQTEQHNTAEEQVLWEHFLSGNNEAFSYFYTKYMDELFAYGMRFSFNRELVKDAVQDVFANVFCSRLRLNRTCNVRMYLYKSMKNTLFNIFGKERYEYRNEMLEPVFEPEYSVEDQIIADEEEAEQKQLIHRMLAVLTPRQKEAIYYRYTEGIEIREICKLMKMNYQSVQNLLQRAIRRIRGNECEDDGDTSVQRLKIKYL